VKIPVKVGKVEWNSNQVIHVNIINIVKGSESLKYLLWGLVYKTGSVLRKTWEATASVIERRINWPYRVSTMKTSLNSKKKTPWPESADEVYRLSDRGLSTKLMPIFTDGGVSRSQRVGSPTAVISIFYTTNQKSEKIRISFLGTSISDTRKNKSEGNHCLRWYSKLSWNGITCDKTRICKSHFWTWNGNNLCFFKSIFLWQILAEMYKYGSNFTEKFILLRGNINTKKIWILLSWSWKHSR
jgi:hypothetical protein